MVVDGCRRSSRAARGAQAGGRGEREPRRRLETRERLPTCRRVFFHPGAWTWTRTRRACTGHTRYCTPTTPTCLRQRRSQSVPIDIDIDASPASAASTSATPASSSTFDEEARRDRLVVLEGCFAPSPDSYRGEHLPGVHGHASRRLRPVLLSQHSHA